jgi:hypothetical protein
VGVGSEVGLLVLEAEEDLMRVPVVVDSTPGIIPRAPVTCEPEDRLLMGIGMGALATYRSFMLFKGGYFVSTYY